MIGLQTYAIIPSHVDIRGPSNSTEVEAIYRSYPYVLSPRLQNMVQKLPSTHLPTLADYIS